MNSFLETTSKPITVGAVAAATYGGLFGFGQSIPIMGQGINAPLAFGVVAGTASLAGAATKNYVVPLVTNNPMGEVIARAAAPVGTGAATAAGTLAIVKLNGGEVSTSGIVTGFGIGAVSEMIGDYAHRTVVEPWMGRV